MPSEVLVDATASECLFGSLRKSSHVRRRSSIQGMNSASSSRDGGRLMAFTDTSDAAVAGAGLPEKFSAKKIRNRKWRWLIVFFLTVYRPGKVFSALS